jgi:hypothetical protein
LRHFKGVVIKANVLRIEKYNIRVYYQRNYVFWIKQKGMTFDHDFGHSFPLFSSLLNNEGRRKENKSSKIVIKGHAFLLDLYFVHPQIW